MVKKFMKRPVVIKACQFTPDIADNDEKIIELASWCNGGVNWSINNDKQKRTIVIKTLEGEMIATVGDWIICGIAGEYYPCKSDIFTMTYKEMNVDDVANCNSDGSTV